MSKPTNPREARIARDAARAAARAQAAFDRNNSIEQVQAVESDDDGETEAQNATDPYRVDPNA
jgi:hypothetical protein